MKDRITVFSIDITIKIPLRFFAFRHSFAECFHRYSAHAIVDKNKDNKTIFLTPNITEPDTGKDFK